MKYRKIMPTDNPKILIVFSKDMVERIEDFRYDNRIPNRSKAIRQLIEKGLQQYEKDKK